MGTILRLVPLSPDQLRLRSLRLGGSLVQEFDARKATGGAWSSSSTSRIEARLNGRGFYWQPWFAQVSANLGASVRVYKPLTGDEREAVPTGRDSAGVATRFFPASRFPLTLTFNVSESHEGYVPLRGVTRSNVSFDIDQTYRPAGSKNRYRLRYRHLIRGHYVGGRDVGSTVRDTVTGTARIGLGKWRDLDLRADYSRSEETRTGRVLRNIVARAIHEIEPMADLRIDTNASVTDSRILVPDPGSEINVGVALLSSVARWKPDGKPYRGGAGVRLGATRTDRDGTVSETRYALLNANGSYDVYRSRLANVTASASVSRRFPDGELVWGASSRQGINWGYGPPSGVWRGFRYRARVFAGANNTLGRNDGFDPVASVGSSQGLSRSWAGGAGSWSWTATHASSLDERASSRGARTVHTSLAHAASLNWRRTARHRADSITASVSDSRKYALYDSERGGGLDMSSQKLDLHYVHREGLGIHGELTAGYRFRGARKVKRDSDSGFGYSSNLYASYRTPGLFGYVRLDYSTTLKIDSPDLVPLSLGEGQDRLAWHHSLTYNIGRLRSSLTAGYTRSAGRYNFDARLRLERRFGR